MNDNVISVLHKTLKVRLRYFKRFFISVILWWRLLGGAWYLEVAWEHGHDAWGQSYVTETWGHFPFCTKALMQHLG